jgi:hypothetical protein
MHKHTTALAQRQTVTWVQLPLLSCMHACLCYPCQKPSTPHPPPSTPYPTPSTLCLIPYTPHPPPSTPYLTPSTPHPPPGQQGKLYVTLELQEALTDMSDEAVSALVQEWVDEVGIHAA